MAWLNCVSMQLTSLKYADSTTGIIYQHCVPVRYLLSWIPMFCNPIIIGSCGIVYTGCFLLTAVIHLQQQNINLNFVLINCVSVWVTQPNICWQYYGNHSSTLCTGYLLSEIPMFCNPIIPGPCGIVYTGGFLSVPAIHL